jgi:two-component system, cell cycle sensor histidine kinase and response regulator CckA
MQIPPKIKPVFSSKIMSILTRFITPRRYKGGSDQLRQFRLLLSLDLGIIFCCIFVLSILFLLGNTPRLVEHWATSTEFYALFVAVTIAISYGTGIAGHYNLSSFLALAILNTAIFATALFARLEAAVSVLNFLPIIILLSSFIQRLRFTFLLLGVNLIGLTFYAIANSHNLRTIIYQPGIALVVFSGFIILGAYHRNRLESERRQELLQKDARFRALVQNSSDIIGLIDGDYRILYVSPAIEKVVGLDVDKVTGTSQFSRVHPEDVQNVRQTFEYAFTHPGETVRTEFRFPHQKTGEWLNLELVGSNQLYETGEKNLFINIRDITQQRRMEQEVQRAQRLEGLGRLAGGIAHDFNNILTVVSGNLSLARQAQLPPETDEVLEEAETATLNARQLSRQLLTFASGGAPVMQPTALAPLIRRAVEVAPGIETYFELAPDLAPVRADADQLEQVIRNLVTNAMQAMPGGGTLKIQAETLNATHNLPAGLDNACQYILISLQDTGDGIAEQNLGRIFDPFFSTKAGKSGLGLATAFSIVRQHEGTIEVDSKPGGGSTFRIYLPTSPNQSTVQTGKTTDAEPPRPKRILVLEDEISIQRILKRLFKQHGFEVEVTEEGEQALELYREALQNGRGYDLIITDLIIKDGLGGKETVQRLQEFDPDAKAIVVSGYSKDDTFAHYEKYGFRGAVAKPFRFEELLEVVNRVVD